MGIKHKWEAGLLLFLPPVFSLVLLSVPFSFPVCWLDFKPDFLSFSNCLYYFFFFFFGESLFLEGISGIFKRQTGKIKLCPIYCQ